jgi:hypothetical protein
MMNTCGAPTNDPTSVDASVNNSDDPLQVIAEQSASWQVKDVELEDARLGSNLSFSSIPSQMRQDVAALLNRLANKSDQLITNATTNLAECWMSVRAKFDGGKNTNRTLRGSWNARCYGAGLRKAKGPEWSPTVWATSTKTDPGRNFIRGYQDRRRRLLATRKHHQSAVAKARRYLRKLRAASESRKLKARKAYGPQATDAPPSELQQLMDEYFQKNVKVNTAEAARIQATTV